MMLWLLLSLATPLLVLPLSLASALHRQQWRLLPLLPLPALSLALLGPADWQLEIPQLLLGSHWQLDAIRQPFFLLTTLLWSVAGLFALGYVQQRRAAFALFWGLILSGNLGLVLAGDLVSFYSCFALMTFAGYGLVVHERKPEAFRAGRVYLVMAVLGEMALLTGLILAAGAANSLLLADLPAGIVAADQAMPIMLLLLVGLGVKAGLPLLHLWLPLAHPVAPTPASAVLSGAMIKAGLLGWLLILPLGQAGYTELGLAIALLGVLASLGAALVGVCQQQTKAVLAYSSISQMGLMVLMLGVVLAEPERADWLLPVIGLYALHHGLAKGTLFLSVGITRPDGRFRRALYWLLLALPGLALAGLPLTSGAQAKLAMKQALAPQGLDILLAPLLSGLLSAGAVATSLLVLRFLWLLRQQPPAADSNICMQLGWGLALASSLLLFPWLVPSVPNAIAPQPGDQLDALFKLLWPILLALTLAALTLGLGIKAPAIPKGDLIVLFEAAAKPGQQTAVAARPRVYTEIDSDRVYRLRRHLSLWRALEPRLRSGVAWLLVLMALGLWLA